jgi:YHS domain-containing protein
VRFAILLLAIALIAIALLPILRRGSWPGLGPRNQADELVKDPVCGTYIVRSRAVSRAAGEGSRYFCSAACARRFAG